MNKIRRLLLYVPMLALASCIQKGTPIGYPCPFAKAMRAGIERELDGRARLIDHTH